MRLCSSWVDKFVVFIKLVCSNREFSFLFMNLYLGTQIRFVLHEGVSFSTPSYYITSIFNTFCTILLGAGRKDVQQRATEVNKFYLWVSIIFHNNNIKTSRREIWIQERVPPNIFPVSPFSTPPCNRKISYLST